MGSAICRGQLQGDRGAGEDCDCRAGRRYGGRCGPHPAGDRTLPYRVKDKARVLGSLGSSHVPNSDRVMIRTTSVGPFGGLIATIAVVACAQKLCARLTV